MKNDQKQQVIEAIRKHPILGIPDIAKKVTISNIAEETSPRFYSENFTLLTDVIDLSCALPVKTDHFAVIISNQGSCKKTSGRAEFDVAERTLHFITPESIHSYSEISDDLNWDMVLFKRQFLTETHLKPPIFEQLIELNATTEPYFTLSEESYQSIVKILQAMKSEIDDKKPYGQQLLKLLTVQLLYEMNRVCEHCLSTSSRQISRQYQLVSAYRRLVDEQFLTTRTVREFSERLKVSPKTLTKAIREETGNSPLQIIHDRVYLEAKFLLGNADFSIKQIAYHLGFDTSSHFGRFFKHHSGVNPSEFNHAHQP